MNDSMQPGERDERSLDDAEDRRLTRLLAAVGAEPNPAVWARVRTRIAAASTPAPSRLDGFLDWLTRPVAMAAASAALLVALGTGWTVLGPLSAEWRATSAGEGLVATDATNLMESLLDPASVEATEASTPESDGVGDDAAPLDSGGTS